MALRGLNILAEQLHLLSYVEELHSGGQGQAFRAQSPACQVSARFAVLFLSRGDLTRLEESVRARADSFGRCLFCFSPGGRGERRVSPLPWF